MNFAKYILLNVSEKISCNQIYKKIRKFRILANQTTLEPLTQISEPVKAYVEIKYSFWIGYFPTWKEGPIHPNFDWTRSLKWKPYRNSLNYCLSIIRYITSSNVLVGPRQDTWESAPGLLDQHQVRLKCTQPIKLHNNY